MFKVVFKVFQSQYLLEGSFEIDETPGIHSPAAVEPINCSLFVLSSGAAEK